MRGACCCNRSHADAKQDLAKWSWLAMSSLCRLDCLSLRIAVITGICHLDQTELCCCLYKIHLTVFVLLFAQLLLTQDLKQLSGVKIQKPKAQRGSYEQDRSTFDLTIGLQENAGKVLNGCPGWFPSTECETGAYSSMLPSSFHTDRIHHRSLYNELTLNVSGDCLGPNHIIGPKPQHFGLQNSLPQGISLGHPQTSVSKMRL